MKGKLLRSHSVGTTCQVYVRNRKQIQENTCMRMDVYLHTYVRMYQNYVIVSNYVGIFIHNVFIFLYQIYIFMYIYRVLFIYHIPHRAG